MNAPQILRLCLILTAIAMLILAWLALARRRLPYWQTCALGLLALGLPFVGPFLVALITSRKSSAFQRSLYE
jgi:hypothetical protein